MMGFQDKYVRKSSEVHGNKYHTQELKNPIKNLLLGKVLPQLKHSLLL